MHSRSTQLRTEFVLWCTLFSRSKGNISRLSPSLFPPPLLHNPQIKSDKPLKFFPCHRLYTFAKLQGKEQKQRSSLPCWALLETGQLEMCAEFFFVLKSENVPTQADLQMQPFSWDLQGQHPNSSSQRNRGGHGQYPSILHKRHLTVCPKPPAHTQQSVRDSLSAVNLQSFITHFHWLRFL